MNPKHLKWTVIVVIGLVVASCSAAEIDDPADSLTYRAGDGEITVQAGEPFVIQLELNSGTDFEWRFAGIHDPHLLDLVERRRRSLDKSYPEGPDHLEWIFLPKAAGSTWLTFEHVHPTYEEAETNRLERFHVTIK